MPVGTAFPGRLRHWVVLSSALLMSDGVGATSSLAYGDLPPAPRMIDADQEQTLYLELIVNGRETGVIAVVVHAQGRFKLQGDDLRSVGLDLALINPAIFLDQLPETSVHYDAARQQLYIQVPPSYLPAQMLGAAQMQPGAALGSTGALLNYELFVSDRAQQAPTASLWHEARMFIPAGVFSTTGVLGSESRRAGGGHMRFTRFDTRWTRSSEAQMTTLEVGDFVTRGLPWVPAVRLGGVQYSRDFSVRPDVVTYPVPSFRGEAALPSTVDLFINNQRISGGTVDPGPFELDTLLPINGVGEANLVVTDMMGRSIATSMPFYVSSALLRPGLTDYATSAGAFRRRYGERNFDYGEVAGTFSLRHGVSNGFTVEGHAALADGLFGAGVGGVVKLGTVGIVSASYSRSRYRPHEAENAHGGQMTAGYEYQARSFSFAVRHMRRDAGFTDLGSLDAPTARMKRLFSSASSSLSVGSFGNLGVAYIDTRSGNGRAAQLANASWSLPFWNGGRLYASVSHDLNQRATSGVLSFSMSLGGERGTMSSTLAHEADGRENWQINHARHMPSQGGLGWSGSVTGGDDRPASVRGDLAWRTSHMEIRGGAYGERHLTGWAGVSGSIVVMDGALFAANRIADSFVVVSTNGEPDIPVRFENQLAGRTNANGHLLIPWGNAYYAAKYEIDPLSLPASVKAPLVIQRVAVARGSGHVVTFPIERMRAARATVVNERGVPLPTGALVTINARGTTYVGWDGLIFIEDLADHNEILIQLPEGGQCYITVATEAQGDDIIDLGTLRCGV